MHFIAKYSNLLIFNFKISELLSQKQKTNKMTPQNIAIVMAPNLLWSPETGDADYVSKVNSTASVNTIVEALVSDWTFFFGDEFTINDFYITMSRDELFPDNGGFPINACDSTMTKSLNCVPSAANQYNNHPNPSSAHLNINSYQTHSRSSSHDTSLILIENEMTGGSTDSLTKRSQSNSSLSDSSPPHQSSPKLPIRRKNTKKAAPTPPDNRSQRSTEHYASISKGTASETKQAMKERFMNSGSSGSSQDDSKTSSNRFLNNETKAQTNASFKLPSTPTSLKQCSGSIENLSATKPDKPPRPAMPVFDSQTLSRSTYKSKGSDNRHNRPIALPRNIMNVARSTENLSSISPVKLSPRGTPNEEDIVQLRDKTYEINRGDKPAIPERPTSLMKSNLRAAFDKFEAHQPILPDNAGIKKTQSFRMSSSPGGNSIGSITGRSLTTLERTHIYNVDKKQVEIIDVDQQNNGNHDDGSSNGKNSSSDKENSDKEKDIERPEKKIDKVDSVIINEHIEKKSNESNVEQIKSSNEPVESNILTTSTMSTSTTSTGNESMVPPQSPRCFEPKIIKRPQIPAPPPPNVTIDPNQGNSEQTHIRRSDTNVAPASDFTKL